MDFLFEIPKEIHDKMLASFAMVGKDTIKFDDLVYFLSFQSKWMYPSEARQLILEAIQKNVIVDQRRNLSLSEGLIKLRKEREESERKRIQDRMRVASLRADAIQKQGFNDYFRDILTSEGLAKFFTINPKDIDIKEIDTEQMLVKAFISESNKDMSRLIIDGKQEFIVHNCNVTSFLTDAKDNGKLCYHIGALFRKIRKDKEEFALDLIHKLSLRKRIWKYAVSEAELKKVK